MIAKKILELLNQKPRLSPIIMSRELNTNIQYVRNALLILSDLNLVRTASRGVYEITSLGKTIIKK